MTDDFRAMINRYRARMSLLRAAFDRQGYLHAISTSQPSYVLLLTKNGSSEAPWRVTSFRDGIPLGHREYDRLEGGGPTQNSLGEFASRDLVLVPRGHLTVLAIRTRVIGAGNSFQILIPLSEIDREGQNYRVIQSADGNREYVPFPLGIAPYTSEIINMPQGFERYDRYLAHEKASNAKALSILQHAFPESHLSEVPFLWDSNYLADKQVTLRIDQLGNLLRPIVRRFGLSPSPAP